MKKRLMKKILANPVDARGRTVYIREIWRNGRVFHSRAICRMEAIEWDDPIMESSGCAGEFAELFRRRDIRDGCPSCRAEVGL